MGNQGPPDAARNTVNVVEEAYLYAIDPNTGERTTIETDDGLLKAVVESDAGNRLTDTLESESVDEQRIRLYAEDGNGDLNEIQAESLGTGVADDTYAQITYLARALDSKSLDEFVSRVTDSNGTQIDPLTQDATEAVGNTELRARVFGPDAAGTLQQANVEAFDTGLAATDIGLATYTARSLEGVGQDHVQASLYADDPNNVLSRLNVNSNGELLTDTSLAAESVFIDADDDDGNTLNPNAETLSEAITDPDGLVTYLARALEGYSEDHLRAALYADDPNNVLSRLNVNSNGELLTDASLDSASMFIDADDDDGNTLNPNAETLSQGITDPDGLVTYLSRALVSQGHDRLRVEGSIEIEGDDDGGNTLLVNAETLSQPLADPNGTVTYLARALNSQGHDELVSRLADSTGTQVDPLDQQDTSPITATDSGTGSANAATLSLGDLRTDIDIFVDTTGSATLTVEVSPDGGTTWRQFDTVSYSAATEEVEQYDTSYPDIRAHLDQNRNLVEMASKGV